MNNLIAPKRLTNQLILSKRLLKHYLLKNNAHYQDPFKIKFLITRKCNLNCQHCGIGSSNETRKELNTEEVIKLLSQNPQIQVLTLSGGEPFLRKDLTEVVFSVFRELPDLLLFSINTNGWLTDKIVTLAKETVNHIPKGCTFFIAVSSDGPEEIHNQIRGNTDSFQKKENTIAELRKLSAKNPAFKVRHNININPWNLDLVIDYIEECEKQGDDVIISMYSASPHYSHSSDHFTNFKNFREKLFDNEQLLQRLRKRETFLSNRFLVQAKDFYASKQKIQPLPCFSLKASLIVESWGDVQPCINYPISLGNVKDFDFDLSKLISSNNADQLRKKIRRQSCPICWTPSEAYVSLMCNLPNPKFWRNPDEALKTILKKHI